MRGSSVEARSVAPQDDADLLCNVYIIIIILLEETFYAAYQFLEPLRQIIARHDRLALGHFPTAIEPLKRIAAKLGGPALFVKRDDASGLGQGGNKVRALEFLIPAAQKAGADVLVTAGVVQSNSVRQVAAAAAKAGLGATSP